MSSLPVAGGDGKSLLWAFGFAPHPTAATHSSRIDTNFVLRISPQERSKLGSCFDLRPARTQSFALGFLESPVCLELEAGYQPAQRSHRYQKYETCFSSGFSCS